MILLLMNLLLLRSIGVIVLARYNLRLISSVVSPR